MELSIVLLFFNRNYVVEGFHNSSSEGYRFLQHDAV
jgi:hypothetical protein